MTNKSIGGYFELELRNIGEYHPNAIALNTARNAFEYVLKVRNYKKVYIPYFTCDVILEPINKLKIEYEFYSINKNLEPEFDRNKIKYGEGFLYTNYFGLKDNFIPELAKKIPNLIIDNAQSFFTPPINNIDTFYSTRKFFGTSDGAYLYCNKSFGEKFEQDISYDRVEHLMKRSDINAEFGFPTFCTNEINLVNQPIKIMSNLTRKILRGIDYESAKETRKANFIFIHQALKDLNRLKINLEETQIPLAYPFWTRDFSLKKRLLKNRIYCPTYWQNVLDWCDKESLEVQLTKELILLPIDQRYNISDMKNILKYV